MKIRANCFLLFWLCLVFGCSAAGALTYQEAYTQASDSDDAADYKVIQTVPKSRVHPDLPDELSAVWTYEGDELIITIDMEKTDWNSVIVKKYNAGAGMVFISPGFASPTGSGMPHRSFGYSIGGENSEKYMIELLRRENEHWGTNIGDLCQNGIEIGRYDEDSGLFQPVETERHGLLCAWGEDGSLQIEYMAITIRYTDTQPITVRLPKVPAQDICALYDMPQSDLDQIALSVTTGTVHAEAHANTQFSQGWGSLAVLVPEEAGSEAWTCSLLTSWGDVQSCEMQNADETGLSRRSACITTLYLDEYQSTREDNYTLEWRDESGTVRSYAQIYLTVSSGDPQPWPYYIADWSPVPASRMTLRKQHFPAGVDAVYDGSGLLRLTIDEDALPDSANFGRAFYAITVDPPADGMAYAGINHSGGNNIIGHDHTGEKDDQILRTRDAAQAIDGSVELVSGNVFRTYHHLGSDMTVYMTAELTGTFAGGVALLSWWKEGDDPATDDPYLTEYIVTQQESCVRVFTSTPYDSEDDLPSVITQPVIIIPQGSLSNPNRSMEFVAHIYPQKGEKGRYYKLELLNPDGTPVDLQKGQYKVFLPFPDGITEEEKQDLELIHMTDAHVEIENFSINGGNLHLTDAGIWFQAKSFSPFMLKWGEVPVQDPFVLPSALTEIGPLAFADCQAFSSIIIPSSVKSIAPDAFEGCLDLTIIGEEGSAAHQFAMDYGFPFEKR